MPTADRYARYRADQTTIWVSKTAAAFLAKERERTGEGTAAALDRLLGELRKIRKVSGTPAAPARAAAKKTVRKAGARKAATRKTTARTAVRRRGA